MRRKNKAHNSLQIAMICVSGFWANQSAASVPAGCEGVINRKNVAQCVIAHSPTLKTEKAMEYAVRTRQQAAKGWLPSNPVLSVSGGLRNNGAQPVATNWYATLSQEIEIGGQRSYRLENFDAEIRSQEYRVELSKRNAAYEAWHAYFEVIAAREELKLIQSLEEITSLLSRSARAAADRGLIAEVEADVIELNELKVTQSKITANAKLSASLETLAAEIGREKEGLIVEGELEPLAGIETRAKQAVPEERVEAQLLAQEQKRHTSRANIYRGQRVPNLTFSVFAQNDGFSEKVIGLGIAVPIPLPSPVGKTYAGEISESEALARKTTADADRFFHESETELKRALIDFDAKTKIREAITQERIDRAHKGLLSLAAEVQKGKLQIRDTIVLQQALNELLLNQIAAKKAQCISSVDLARAAGLSLEEGQP